jgi:hypothetical protein
MWGTAPALAAQQLRLAHLWQYMLLTMKLLMLLLVVLLSMNLAVLVSMAAGSMVCNGSTIFMHVGTPQQLQPGL